MEQPTASLCLPGFALCLAGLLLVPAVAADTAETIEGDVHFENLEMTGENRLSTPSLEALHLIGPEKQGAGGQWGADATQLEVAWTRWTWTDAGPSPDGGDAALVGKHTNEETGRERFDTAHVTLGSLSLNSTLLLVAEGDSARAEIDGERWQTQPAGSDEQWQAGDISRERTRAGGDDVRLKEAHELPAGAPVHELLTAGSGTVEGSFTVYLWEVNATVNTPNGTETYRSGSWRTNETGKQAADGGVTWQEHKQLLELHVTNGTMSFDHGRGQLRWTAPQTQAHTEGTVHYLGSQALLSSGDTLYTTRGEPLQMDGTIDQQIGATDAPDTLAAEVTGQDVALDVPASASLEESAEESLMIWGLALAGTVTTLGGGLWYARDRSEDDEVVADLTVAEEALVRHDSQHARDIAMAILENHPRDVDAWVVYGMALLQDRRYDAAVHELRPIANEIPEDQEGLAFLIAFALAQKDELDEAVRWALIACEEPALARKVETFPTFHEVRAHPRYRQERGGSAADDPAYG